MWFDARSCYGRIMLVGIRLEKIPKKVKQKTCSWSRSGGFWNGIINQLSL